MRILYVSADPGVPVLGQKGASVHVRELATALARAGARVTIASPRIEPAGDEIDASVSLAEIPPVLAAKTDEAGVRARVAAQAERILALAAALRPDAIYERYSLFGSAGATAAAQLGVPHVLEVNAPLREEAARFRTLPHPALARELEQSAFARTQRIFAVSETLAALLSADGVPPGKVEVLPNAVAAERFAEQAARGDRPFTVGFAGSLKPWHGIDILVDAARRAARGDERVRFEIVGGGPLDVLLAAAELPADRFVRHGVVPHARALEILRGWHVGIAPYLDVPNFYFSPLKVLEYMAAGLCVVASDLGQIRTLLGGGTRGVLVPPGDPGALADACLELAASPARAAELGRHAREHVLSSFTWDRNAARVRAALEAQARRAAA